MRAMMGYRGLLAVLLAFAMAVAVVAVERPQTAAASPKVALPSGWTTYGHDNSRNAYDASAPAFRGGPFSTWDQAVDQDVYAQPLAVGGRVYVATMGDSVYAFDATTGNQVWARTGPVGPTGALAAASTDTFCSFNPGSIGIMSTPVIDTASGILYAVGLNTITPGSSWEYQVFALNTSNGTDVAGFPVTLSVSPSFQNQRAALSLANGRVYVPFGGWAGDCGTYHPFIVSVPTTGGAQDHLYGPQTTCQNAAGMWGASGLAVDGSGNIYGATGNGNGCPNPQSFPCDTTYLNWDHSEAVLKLTATLSETSFWTPNNAAQNWCDLNNSDTDVGSIGPILLPNNELFQTGKGGFGWMLSTAALGGFNGQQFQSQIGTCRNFDAVFGGQAYYNGRLYVPCDGYGLVAFSVNTITHKFTPTPDWVQNVTPGPPIAAMGLIWARDQAGNWLYGFDATTGAQLVKAPLGGGSNHFATPAEDGGWVFAAHGANIRAFNFTAPPCPSTTSAHWFANCSYGQYSLAGNNGTIWTDMDPTNLKVTFTPAVNSFAVISGNADLWTSRAGYNQDIGLAVSGGTYPTTALQPEAWKESGGGATFSPNAAFVQTVIPVTAAIPYTVTLQWKASRSDPGSIMAGAGPIAGSFSPTRVSVQLFPTSAGTVFNASSTAQRSFLGSDGASWRDMDGTNLSVPFTPPAGSWLALVSGNADLWTSTVGLNQDIGLAMTGTGYPTSAFQPEAWKESGGSAGTFSPNAAFVQAALPVTGGIAYTARLQWKANKATSGSIFAGAGPIIPRYSPTSISVVLIPNPAGAAVKSTTLQNKLFGSNGSTWQTMGSTALTFTLSPGSTTNYLLSANADLWTTVAGYNQDIGIMVSGGTFGSGTLVTWKESGGPGAFSPNAAIAFGDVALPSGVTYTVWIVWKTNRSAAGVTIYSGAGPIGSKYSFTSLTAQVLN